MAKELKKVNVVTVGVGFTGGIALAECAKAGLSVVGLERGDRRGVEDFQDIHDEWRYAVNYGLMQDLSKETITFRNTEEMRALPMRKLGSFLRRRCTVAPFLQVGGRWASQWTAYPGEQQACGLQTLKAAKLTLATIRGLVKIFQAK